MLTYRKYAPLFAQNSALSKFNSFSTRFVSKERDDSKKMKSNAFEYIGKEVNVIVDRPLGSVHPKYPDLIYLANYGYVPNTVSGDGEELNCYILGEINVEK